ncbi:hypothetical protein MAC_03294 [Metarhizium acridum CQMa 102]|uniref:ATP synthase F0 n=1 Tax=Metarhizium acridum (strain CQMa 102) TaxID=655827 RepID=E9E0B3_METAQ|nr:uncharacterized protein MAC_03294 [Metarhizium acridum CQMa 102]EFY90714.1 hypothetical protein MAC_03294 [Metarhizium acridum CQMa 102]
MKKQPASLNEVSRVDLDRRFDLAHVIDALTWGVSAGVSIYYTVRAPRDGPTIGARIWDQNFQYETGLTIDPNMVIAYWVGMHVALFVHMLANIFAASNDISYITISNHFSINNLLHVVFLVLFVRSAFDWAECILILNFVNLSVLYFKHSKLSHFTRISVICGPLAWNFIAIFWNWAIAVTAGIGYNDTVEGFGLFFVWAILGYGVFSLLVFQDLAMAFLLAYLCASIAFAQRFLQRSDRMWIPPVVIASLLVVMMCAVAARCLWNLRAVRRKKVNESVDAEFDERKVSC